MAFDAFIKLDGIPGESSDDKHKDWIEILSFSEPEDYLPKPRWIDQLDGKKLDDELSLKRAIRPISGATLSGRAIVNASRKVLAIHRVIQSRPVAKAGAAK